MPTTNLFFEHPFDLALHTSIEETKIKGEKLRILLKETIGEIQNPEGGDIGSIYWEGGLDSMPGRSSPRFIYHQKCGPITQNFRMG